MTGSAGVTSDDVVESAATGRDGATVRVDHLIVSAEQVFSFRRERLL